MTSIDGEWIADAPELAGQPLGTALHLLRHLVPSAEPAVVFTSLARLCVPEFSGACTVTIVEEGRPAYCVAYPRGVSSAQGEQGIDSGESRRRVSTPFNSTDSDLGPRYRGTLVHAWPAEEPRSTSNGAHICAARILADHAVNMITQERLADRARRAENKVTNLEFALAHSRQIGYAIGIIMATQKVTVDAAFAILRVASQRTHRKIRDIADDIVQSGCIE